MKKDIRSYMTWQEAQDALTAMFPPETHIVVLHHSQHIGGGAPLSDVTASVYYGQQLGIDAISLFHSRKYDEHCDMDDGGWAAVVNDIKHQLELYTETCLEAA